MIEKTEFQTVLENLNIGGTVTAYSGRGMYGKECIAITSDHSLGYVLAALVRAVGLGVANVDTIEEAVRVHRTDSMGRLTCVYFPGFAYTDHGDDDASVDEEG